MPKCESYQPPIISHELRCFDEKIRNSIAAQINHIELFAVRFCVKLWPILNFSFIQNRQFRNAIYLFSCHVFLYASAIRWLIFIFIGFFSAVEFMHIKIHILISIRSHWFRQQFAFIYSMSKKRMRKQCLLNIVYF